MSALSSSISWRQYICRACGLIYDEEDGDPDSGLAAGTRFEDIPDDWSCPLCGVTKADFELYVAVSVLRKSSAIEIRNANARRGNAGVVIVGAGCAGWHMARVLRELDASMPITLVTACNGDVYDKPLLSIAMARGLLLPDLVKETASQAAARLNIRLLTQTHAISIAADSSILRTTRGALRYRHLVLAHGASQRVIPQMPEALCWRINDLQAYTEFRKRIDTQPNTLRQRVLIAGAGLVGCELANDLALGGYQVLLLDINKRPLHGVLSDQKSEELLAAWKELPLQFVGSVRVANVRCNGTMRQVTTEDGQIFEADHVVSAIGLDTPSQLARTAGLAWNNGIAVDAEKLRTNVGNIHALGDCISIDGNAYRFIEPINRQARIVAANITGDNADHYVSTRPVVRVKTSSCTFTI